MYGSYICTSYEGKSDYAREQLLETANADIRQAPYLQSEDEDPTAKQKVQLQTLIFGCSKFCHVQMYYCIESNLTSTKLLEAFHRQS